MTSNNYYIGFAATQIIPPDQIALVEITVAEPMDAITRHEFFVGALTAWTCNTGEGQYLCQEIDGPVTIGAILESLDSQTLTSLEFWLEKAGIHGFRVRMSNAVFDLDALVGE